MKIGNLQFPIARAFDRIVVSGKKFGEIHRFAAFDIRHEQIARAVFFLDVDGNAEIYTRVFESRRLVVNKSVSVI